ncbi:hypothetical protein EGR_00402 [Echinococcus granulosus]|uniref:Uncharacterized protein n=1 Tax=Echinococcus granulosus TaxID=6210 RepID=W6UUZ8_ECHGR|nr:hypothetical protein EGR_00402 [Echinococcus granulosus]EUB65133.1 hypothetical protein EGR_00402 [Echinococcus granulosus]
MVNHDNSMNAFLVKNGNGLETGFLQYLAFLRLTNSPINIPALRDTSLLRGQLLSNIATATFVSISLLFLIYHFLFKMAFFTFMSVLRVLMLVPRKLIAVSDTGKSCKLVIYALKEKKHYSVQLNYSLLTCANNTHYIILSFRVKPISQESTGGNNIGEGQMTCMEHIDDTKTVSTAFWNKDRHGRIHLVMLQLASSQLEITDIGLIKLKSVLKTLQKIELPSIFNHYHNTYGKLSKKSHLECFLCREMSFHYSVLYHERSVYLQGG